MPIATGNWKATVNGVDIDLVIDPPEQRGVLANRRTTLQVNTSLELEHRQ
jgi:hypothetical protein